MIGFQAGLDQLQLQASDFGLAAGALAAGDLVFGVKAADHHAEFIYDAATGKLSWDADGVGGQAAVLVAALSNHAALTSTDFILV